ncbi:MAG: di-trans,poly-cis-decaprenylcistransferase [Candidatus Melainabacteria bacterium GWF2_37_15]|nr:MAG: di-trans,poly-cis-decaprenylcistransferase [Candidatus Melainabacteria bacterium GWF2_37_15]
MNNTIIKTDSIKEAITLSNLRHIAIIMDGNRRWAKSKNLPSMFGHKEGVKALKRTLQAASDFGIKYLTVYAFSTENWGRKQDEVEFLMRLLNDTVRNEIKEMHENNVRVRIIGDLQPLSEGLKATLKHAEELTCQNSGVNLQIAINYGSRNEITNAVKRILKDIKDPEQITDQLISDYLYTFGIPDPDLLVRTGGENRVSNYLLWQIAYTELYVTDTFWPEFGEKALLEAAHSFVNRNRRFGKD